MVLLKMLPVGPLGVNCYIVASEETKKAIIVDPGDEPDTILRTIKDLGLQADLIVLTHAHFDHTMALARVIEETGAKFALHPLEIPFLNKVPGEFANWFGPMDPLPDPDFTVEDGDKVTVDGLELTVIHTPGHTPGGICLLGDGFVISGDTLFALSVGRADFPGSDWNQLIDSIKTRLLVLPDETMVYPGHGGRTKIGLEKEQNPFVGTQAEL
ncbi:MAG: MBL fold metallo-hydrolase [Dehalococcoidia bacterium]|nr:MBL fold metallo-hydrolase [Dehalococcoidia bacterium]